MVQLANEVRQPGIVSQRRDEIVREIQRLDIRRKEAQKGLVTDMNNLTALEKVQYHFLNTFFNFYTLIIFNNNYNFAFACKKFNEVGDKLKEYKLPILFILVI